MCFITERFLVSGKKRTYVAYQSVAAKPGYRQCRVYLIMNVSAHLAKKNCENEVAQRLLCQMVVHVVQWLMLWSPEQCV